MTTPLSEQYRADMRQHSASAIYRPGPTPEQRAAQRPSIYADGPAYSGLGSYMDKKHDKLDQRPGESYSAYERRLTAVARALPEGEVERRLEAAHKLASEQAWSWENQRADFDGRQLAGTAGMGTPQQRAAAIGSRFGGREIQAQGHLVAETISGAQPLSAVEVNAVMRQREAERQEIPAGSSGTGWFTR